MNSADLIKFTIDNLKQDSRFADIDMSETSTFYNLNILPFALLLKPVKDLNQNTLNGMQLSTMSDVQLDNYATNLFVKRKAQNYTMLEITIYFANPTSIVEPCIITISDEFRTSSNQVYKPVQNHIIDINTLPLVNGRRIVTIMTTSSSNYTIVLEGSIKTSTVSHISLESITNLSKSSVPPSLQTNDQFITAIQNSITFRGNSTPASIYTNITQNFPDVIDCLTVCYGDPEMQRDIAVAAKDWSGHFGGMTDILIRSSVIPTTFTIPGSPTVSNDGISFTLRRYKGYDWYATDIATPGSYQLMPWTQLDTTPLPILPMLFINWANTSIDGHTIALNSNTGQPDYIIEVLPDPIEKSYGKNYRFSQYENLRITIKTVEPVTSTANAKLSYYTLSNLSNIQNYISQYENRSACSNNLVRSFIPIEINKLVVVYKGSNFNQTTWKQNLADLINNYNSTDVFNFVDLFKTFPASVLISEVWKDNNNLPYDFNNDGEINSVVTPIPATGSYPTYAIMTQHNIDGSRPFYASTRQLYQLKTSNGLSATSRTCRYFILPENITFEQGV